MDSFGKQQLCCRATWLVKGSSQVTFSQQKLISSKPTDYLHSQLRCFLGNMLRSNERKQLSWVQLLKDQEIRLRGE